MKITDKQLKIICEHRNYDKDTIAGLVMINQGSTSYKAEKLLYGKQTVTLDRKYDYVLADFECFEKVAKAGDLV